MVFVVSCARRPRWCLSKGATRNVRAGVRSHTEPDQHFCWFPAESRSPRALKRGASTWFYLQPSNAFATVALSEPGP